MPDKQAIPRRIQRRLKDPLSCRDCRIVAAIIGLLVAHLAEGRQASEEFRIDAASSTMVVHVGRSGIFGFAGHDHEVAVPAITGSVMLDQADVSRSNLSLQFNAAALKVTGKG